MLSRIWGGSPNSAVEFEAGCSGDNGRVDYEIPMGIPHGAMVVGNGHHGQDDYSLDVGVGATTEGYFDGSRAKDYLSPENPPSPFNIAILKECRYNYCIPTHVHLFGPDDRDVRADWDLPGMTCLYHYPFKVGFRFVLPRLVYEVCDYYEIVVGQLMPNGRRRLMAIEVLAELEGIDIGRDEILTAFSIQIVNKVKCFYRLVARRVPGLDQQLLGKGEDCDRYWKEHYFFVPFASLGLPYDSHIPRLWQDASRTAVKFDPADLRNTKRKLRVFLALGVDDWRVVLTEDNLRKSWLWSLVPPLPSGDRAIVSHMMSEAPRAPLSKAVIEKMRRLQKEVAEAKAQERPSAAPLPTTAAARGAKMARKRRPIEVNTYALDDRGICLNFLPESSAYSEFTPCLEESKKLLFPSDRSTFDQLGFEAAGKVGVANAFKTMQALIYQNETSKQLHGRVTELEAELTRVQSEADVLRADLAKDEALAAERLKARDLEVEHRRSTSLELTRLQSQLDLARKEADIIAIKTEVLVSADYLRKIQSGKTDWNYDEVFALERDLQASCLESPIVPPADEDTAEFDDSFTVADYLGVQPGVEESGLDQSGH